VNHEVQPISPARVVSCGNAIRESDSGRRKTTRPVVKQGRLKNFTC
jgi:hypothetical protein